MRLKRLRLHGYKSFASKVDLVFDNGVTAVVGPNGSGKSNIADAVRWVLGEQSYGVLRGKKTEDMIFGGSSQRARMGMAEAVIVLDNSDNWLPIDFDEVVIARRAYRSGENEYSINGSRVRLRDVSELLDRSGLGRRTSTVIGQGMIDQALALRPEDRRILFEEAAGITGYQQKRRLTLDRLQQTEDNLTRVRDIMAEITPRLRQLDRQAERARQYEEASAELRQHLTVWHGYNWRLALSKLVDAQAAVAHWQQTVERTNEAISQHGEGTSAQRQRQAELRGLLAMGRRQLSDVQATRAAITRDLAVGQERQRALSVETDRLQHELNLLTDRLAGQQQSLHEAEAVLQTTLGQRAQHETQLNLARAELRSQDQLRRQAEGELAAARRKSLELSAQRSGRENRMEQAKERRLAIQAERASDLTAADQAAAEASQLDAANNSLRNELRALGERISGVRQRQRETETRRQQYSVQRSELQSQRAELDAQLRTLRARHDLLDRLRSEGEGLFAGVRHVMAANQQGKLRGVVGPVATIMSVPDRYEQAIEVALGGRLQDVVMESWDDADRAIAFSQANARRARHFFTPGSSASPGATPGANRARCVGMGCRPDRVRPEGSPRRGILARPGACGRRPGGARRVSLAKDRPRIVTLEGDFVHPGGSVSGGSREERQKGGILAREREWRRLPGQMQTAVAGLKDLSREIEGVNQAILAVDDELKALAEEASRLSTEERERNAALGRLQNAIDRARQTENWHRNRAQKLAAELETFGRRLTQLRQEVDQIAGQQEALSQRTMALEERLATLSTEGLMQAVAHAQARLDAVEGNARSQQALIDSHRSSLRQTDAELRDRQLRLQATAEEATALATRMEQMQAEFSAANESYQDPDAANRTGAGGGG